jgi:hypothetical protein
MERLTENKIVLVVRPTRLDDLIVRFNTVGQARFYVEHLGADFSDYAREHERYQEAMAAARSHLSALGRVQVLKRAYVSTFVFGPGDVVVVLGQDGLVANVCKYLDGQSVLGVNPDPERWEGKLLPFAVGDLPRVVPEVFAAKRPVREVTMAQVRLSSGEVLHGVNDLFIGPRSHTSARYLIEVGEKKELQSSSGIIVSTGMGSTGWLRSILAGANGIHAFYSQGKRLEVEEGGSFAWDAPYLFFTVREPWPSKTTSAGLSFGRITPKRPLRLVSQMPENGVIFSDGIESDYLHFNSGMHATITVAEKKGRLVG